MQATPLPNFNITGNISVERVTTNIKRAHLYLLMGPTGAGKSSFIESLAGDTQKLSISSSRLAPCTQSITAFRLVNVLKGTQPIYLIDTPGFSDNTISELEIMDMVRAWLEDNSLQYFHNILYMMPINETRLPGSKRRTIEMLKEFIEPSGDLASIVFTTSMWDQVFNERTKQRSESNFAQFQEILKDLVERGSTITRFENTKISALDVVKCRFRVNYSFTNAGSYTMLRLYDNLHDLIANALRDKRMLEDELAPLNEKSQVDDDLKLTLEDRLKSANKVLDKLIGQWLRFGDPPIDAERRATELRKEIIAAKLPLESRYLKLLNEWKIRPVPKPLVQPRVPEVSPRPRKPNAIGSKLFLPQPPPPLDRRPWSPNPPSGGPLTPPDTPSSKPPADPPTPQSTERPKTPTLSPPTGHPTALTITPLNGQVEHPITPPSKLRQSSLPITPESMPRPKLPTNILAMRQYLTPRITPTPTPWQNSLNPPPSTEALPNPSPPSTPIPKREPQPDSAPFTIRKLLKPRLAPASHSERLPILNPGESVKATALITPPPTPQKYKPNPPSTTPTTTPTTPRTLPTPREFLKPRARITPPQIPATPTLTREFLKPRSITPPQLQATPILTPQLPATPILTRQFLKAPITPPPSPGDATNLKGV